MSKLGSVRLVAWSAFVACIVAFITLGVDVWLAQRVGILADGLPYDGITYALQAKAMRRSLQVNGADALRAVPQDLGPGWTGLMTGHLWLLGDGDLWQAYTVRFWPIFLFLFLTLWLGARHGGRPFALCVASVGALLPIVSPNAFLILSHAASGTFYPMNYSYLADPRPDFLYAILLMLALVTAIEGDGYRSRTGAVANGVIIGAAVLVKPSTSLVSVGVWGLALSILAWRHRQSAKQIIVLYALAGLGLLAVVLPWGLAGGFRMTFNYLRNSALGPTAVFLWGLQERNLGENLAYYIGWFQTDMGRGFAVALALLAIIHAARPRLLTPTASWGQLLIYAGLAIVLYAIPTAEIVKNYFLALPAYFMAWIVFIVLAAGVWRRFTVPRSIQSAIATGSILALLVLFLLAIREAQKSTLGDYHYNLHIVQRMARDARKFLSNDDQFLTYWTAQFPGILEYYMMDPGGKYPRETLWKDALPVMINRDAVSRQNFLSSAVKPSKAILMFQDDISAVVKKIYVPRGGEAVLHLIQAYVEDPASGLCAYAHYAFRRLRPYDTYGGLSVVLYVRCSARTRLVLGDRPSGASPPQEFPPDPCQPRERRTRCLLN
jgi:hypothetical protein